MKIYLNPGHCVGKDSGAVGNGLQEAERNFVICRILASMLRSYGHQVVFGAQIDDLQGICDDANKTKADLFISVHCNSFGSNEPKGCETYFFEGSAKGAMVARAIQNELSQKLVDRGIKTDSLYVVRNTNMIAVLVECGFISNYDDAHILRDDPAYFAAAICRGINAVSSRLF